jgi:hypothetical protein
MRSDEYQNLTLDEEEHYVKKYQEWRDTRNLGEWITARSKTNDVIATTKKIEVEVQF